jgi:transcriptional regulator with XRE-family HTH domain
MEVMQLEWCACAGREVTSRYGDRVEGVPVRGDRLRAAVEKRAGSSVREAAQRLGVGEDRLNDWYAERVGPEPGLLHRTLAALTVPGLPDVDILDVLPLGTPRTLRVLRWAAGLTVQQLRAQTKISRRRWEHLESGRAVPTEQEAQALSTALGVDPQTVLEASGEHAPPITVQIQMSAQDAAFVESLRREDESLEEAANRFWGSAMQAFRTLTGRH